MKKITIIGAGIGGLTTAIALRKKGFDVEIFETTPEFKNVGAGIGLGMNAMQVYKHLGLYDEILRQGNYTNLLHSSNRQLKVIGSVHFENLETVFHVKNVAIHRAVLHEILIRHAGDTPIHLGKKLKSLHDNGSQVTLEFEDGTEHVSHLVIGADGIHSAVRASLFGPFETRDARQLCWRGISSAQLDPKYNNALNEAWGKGSRFGFAHISKDLIYWFALVNKDGTTNRNTDLTALFSGYHPVITELIKATPKERVLFNEIRDLAPIDTWYKGNVCLLGDAVHATTPNLGQGACQAIESAMVLSICLDEEPTIEQAFSRYQSTRIEKAHYVTKTSWRLGKLAQTANPLIAFLRNLIIRLIPESRTEKQNRKLFSLNFSLGNTGKS